MIRGRDRDIRGTLSLLSPCDNSEVGGGTGTHIYNVSPCPPTESGEC